MLKYIDCFPSKQTQWLCLLLKPASVSRHLLCELQCVSCHLLIHIPSPLSPGISGERLCCPQSLVQDCNYPQLETVKKEPKCCCTENTESKAGATLGHKEKRSIVGTSECQMPTGLCDKEQVTQSSYGIGP